MLKPICCSAILFLVAGCGSDAARDGLAQCAGNHRTDSIAVWQQRAPLLLDLPYVTDVAAHPSRRCLAVGLTDTSYARAVRQELRRLEIPADAVVLTAAEVESGP